MINATAIVLNKLCLKTDELKLGVQTFPQLRPKMLKSDRENLYLEIYLGLKPNVIINMFCSFFFNILNVREQHRKQEKMKIINIIF